jgi:putative addiction module killer protein
VVQGLARPKRESSDRHPHPAGSLGNFGDVKSVGDGVRELRVDYGPGYRLYFVQRQEVLVILLCGGDKRTQDKDIRIAKTLAKTV